MNVKNSNCLRKLSLRSLKRNRLQLFMTIVAIVVTTTLFSTLYSVALGTSSAIENYTSKVYGTCSHAVLYQADEETANEIASRITVRDTGKYYEIGYYDQGHFEYSPAFIRSYDENTAKWDYVIPTTGNVPTAEDDIVMDTFVLSELGIDPEIGAQVDLTYNVTSLDGRSETETHTFTLSGYYDPAPGGTIHPISVSQAYVDSINSKYGITKNMNVEVRFWLKDMTISEVYAIQDEMGLNDKGMPFIPNQYIESTDTAHMMDIIITTGAFVLLIFVIGFLMINNIFRIKLAAEIRYYGLLKTIGVTSKQLKKMIRYETWVLCALGFPFGVFFGILAGTLITPKVLAITTLEGAVASSNIIPVVLASVLFSLITVFISNSAAVSKVAKVSPMESLRYNEAVKIKPHKSKAKKGCGVNGIARKSLSSNKLKTALVVLSMALAIVLFICVSILRNGINTDSMVLDPDYPDFIVSTSDYFAASVQGSFLSDDDIIDLSKLGGDTTYLSYMPDQDIYDFTDTRLSNRYFAQFVGLDDNSLSKVDIIDGSTLTGGNTIDAIVVDFEDCPIKVGDELTIACITKKAVDLQTGEEVSMYNIDLSNSDGYEYVEESEEFTIRVCGKAACLPSCAAPRYSFLEGIYFMVSDEDLNEITGGDMHILSYSIDTDDEAELQEIEDQLAAVSNNNTGAIRYESQATLRMENKELSDMFTTMGYFLCAVVGVVAVLNFINVVMTDIVSRKREFALLRSVGMTSVQLRNMMITQCSTYSVLAFILAFPIAVVFLNMLKGTNLPWLLIQPGSLITPILMLIPVFAILSIIVPALASRKIMQGSAMDELRETA